MHTRTKQSIFLIALIIAAALLMLLPRTPAHAQGGSATDLIAAVNAYRAANGLAPYDVDGGLSALAQSHSDYQASIETCTHARADGSGPGDYGISAENIACGINLSVQAAINYQWADALHTATLLGPDTGLIGAGVTISGSTVYYTVAVKRLTGDFTYNPPAAPPASDSSSASQGTVPDSAGGALAPASFQGIPTSTPNEDGSIAHVIKYGETLVEIADRYSIPLNELISMNKLDPQNPVYYEGQVLLIRLAFTATPFITETYTPRPPTRTPMPSRTPRPTRTATEPVPPTEIPTETKAPLFQPPTLEELGPIRPIMAYAFIFISALGLLVLVLTTFLPGKKQ